ncbi:flagellin [Sphingomonas lenta]|uniref:Flagellin n=1 Tax=Sphingomonas lenta TaxID=1141887 RepID=A0A2A2SFI4_9SPHN|nr:flagellin [Sphingomonas lenta]PAX07962.1 flagellar biosynthesis protein FlgL [Sphingomonas lenta]
MQVPTNRFYDAAARNMGRLASRADALQVQIATGKRLAAPSDDALAYRRLEGLRQAKADDATYGANLKLAGSVLAQADTVLGEVNGQLQRASELAIRAANGTMNPGDRKVIAIELNDIAEALVQLVNTTDGRGLPLFGGAGGEAAATLQPDGSYTLAQTVPTAMPVGDGQTIQANDAADRVFGFEGKKGPTDVIAVVADIVAVLEAGGEMTDDLKADMAAALDQTETAQASLGARGARIDMLAAQMQATAANREEARSGLEDADITETVTELQKTMTILQATQASFAKLSSLSLFDYLR